MGLVLALGALSAAAGAAESEEPGSAPLVNSGLASAVIVLADPPTPSARLAAIELQYAVEKMTGVALSIQAESDPQDAALTQIHVGAQAATRELGLDPELFEHSEMLCQVESGRIVLLGKDAATSSGRHINFNALVGREGELTVHLPGMYEPQGSLRAAYHFIESLGVRYYGPREHLCIYPKADDLSAAPARTRRQPAIGYTNGLSSDQNGFVYWPLQRILYNQPSNAEVLLFARRVRTGGKEWKVVNHSIASMRLRERFGPPPPDGQAGIHEAHHPDIWPPPGSAAHQPCFSSPLLAQIVAADAGAYFDGELEGKSYGPGWPGLNYYTVVPNDSYGFCTCETCAESYKKHANPSNPGAFGSGHYSDNFFGFLNRVAKQLAESHPDKFIATLAYEGYFWPPKDVELEPNILVSPCIITCDHWKTVQRDNDWDTYSVWIQRSRRLGHPIYLWNYFHHPEELGNIRGHKVFPQFSPKHIHRLARRYARDQVDGVFLCGWGEGLDFYVLMKCFDDPGLDLDELLDEYFSLSFGPEAGAHVKRFYRRIEHISMRSMDGPVNVDERFFWEVQGNGRVLNELERMLDRAEAALPDDLARARFAAWRNLMEYMKQGRAEWLAKQPQP